ncbi:exo-alpha-sialidase [Aliikangiella sp. G2MR2-5]|uniref:WD40/YVTN/BNR-like repeat-containing protein n=1 Tax=Aliikangiella sp. G2MR2-5 TaxID=2788943 RepID=UPI0018AAA8E8|nr:exo-alpha-sialidase [Aliikangiella sp. G2MR2-5]
MGIRALIATRKGLFRLNQDKTLEPVDFLGVPVSMTLAAENRKYWYAALDHGHFGVKLHRSEDSGKSWQEINCPSYSGAESGDEKPKAFSLNLIWSLAYADDGPGDKLWAGTVPGGLFYSKDAGLSWHLNEYLWQKNIEQSWFGGGFDSAGIHSICVDPRDHNEVKIAVSCAGVWVTRDSGKSWKNCSKGMRAEYMPPDRAYDVTIQDPHLLVQCATNPDHLWVQHHNGIFKSSDNAASWQEVRDVEPSVFGFATAVHPRDPECAWFVPGVKDECRIPVDGKLVVTCTRDGGKSFEKLTAGLPQQPSYDLVFRHGLDIDKSGEQLLLGSTTGNLWLTENQGNHWQCLSTFLPPIYAVRFL